MAALQMAKLSSLIYVISVILPGVAGKVCYYNPTSHSQESAVCIWGCCYKTMYPCCDPPLYATTEFIVLMSVGSFLVTMAVVVAVICIVIRRRAAASQFGTVLAVPHTVTTTPGINSYAIHYNMQYPAPGVYPTQPTNETTPMYSAQPYIGAAPTYTAQPSRETTPMYPAQTFISDCPAYEGPPPKKQ